MKVNDTLVNAHFKAIPSVGTLSRGSLASGNPQLFGGHADRATNVQLFIKGALFQIGTDFFNIFDIARCERNANPVNLRVLDGRSDILFGSVTGHDDESLPTT